MAWIESHQTLRDHPKLYAFMDNLGVAKPQAVGHLHMFWWWCCDYAPEGKLRHNDAQLARAGEWTGEPAVFVKALIAAGFLDRQDGVLAVHDWQEFRLHYEASMERKERKLEQVRQRVQAFRDKKRTCNAPVTECNAATEPNRTKPNLTKPNVRSSVRQGEQSEQQTATAGRCDYTYPDKARCSYPREGGAYMCRSHIEKCRELAADKGQPRGGW